MKPIKFLPVIALLALPLAGHGQIITTFAGSNPVASSSLTIGNFTANGTGTNSADATFLNQTALPGVTGNFSFTALAWESISVTGNTWTTGNSSNLARNATNGWGVSLGFNGDISGSVNGNNAIVYTFDLSTGSFNPGVGQKLVLTGMTFTVGTTPGFNLIQSGVTALTNQTGTSITGLSWEITNGTQIAIQRSGAASTNDFRIRTMTLEVIPEPSTGLLLGAALAGLTMLRRRRA